MSGSSSAIQSPFVHVGLDVHKKTIAVAALPETGGGFLLDTTVSGTNLKGLRKALTRLSKHGSVVCCYEASCAGFYLHRVLQEWGFACQVIAPSMIPQLPGQRRKNDRLDARRLAEFHRTGHLTVVHVPTPEEEAVRDFVRLRAATRKDLQRARSRVVKFLLRWGHTFTAGQNWTVAYWNWLSRLRLPVEVDQETLSEYMSHVDGLTARLQDYDRRIEALAAT